MHAVLREQHYWKLDAFSRQATRIESGVQSLQYPVADHY